MTTSQNQISFSSANRGSRELPYRATQCAPNAGTALACMSLCSTRNQHWRLLSAFSVNLAQPDALSRNGNHMQQWVRRRYLGAVDLSPIAFMKIAHGVQRNQRSSRPLTRCESSVHSRTEECVRHGVLPFRYTKLACSWISVPLWPPLPLQRRSFRHMIVRSSS